MATIATSQQQQHPGDSHSVPDYQSHTLAATSIKSRVAQHYDLASSYYHSLWGQHIHHGLFTDTITTKDAAQVNLIDHLLDISGLTSDGVSVLDVGCGIGGTGRYLAREKGCSVTGITISAEQVNIARRITAEEASKFDSDRRRLSTSTSAPVDDIITDVNEKVAFASFGPGQVRFIHLDAEKALEYFTSSDGRRESFSYIWISECLSHVPDQARFFTTAFALLSSSTPKSSDTISPTKSSVPQKGSKLVVADWFRAEDLTEEQVAADIKPIEDGMLLPGLKTVREYVRMAEDAGFKISAGPEDLSEGVKKTWDISWSLVSSPSLWAFAIAQGRDGLAFLQSFRAMRRGYANGTFRYAVMVFEKP